ncbi:MAG: multidrug effflux MFS transporter [Marinosulfonomonas sp.]|nr:multidrug effflux MFS transporter [Marinosulfonomonas sp.]
MDKIRRLRMPEFVALLAFLFATVAFSIDAMLPGLPQIAAELTPDAVNRAQLLILIFMFGIGFGTIIAGPVSDAFGRKITVTMGMAIYAFGAALAYFAQSLELVLVARAIQGFGTAAPRIVALAIIRDLYEGRRMAQITSLTQTVFMVIPAVAPFIGSYVIDAFGWRSLFILFVIFALINTLWLNLRQPETLSREKRRPLNPTKVLQAFKEVTSNRRVMIYTAALTLGSVQMTGMLASVQPIYDVTYGRADAFPTWFALSALLAAAGPVLNAVVVLRIGMRRLAMWAYGLQTVLALAFFIAYQTGALSPTASFVLWFIWSSSIFIMAGLTFGNLIALALQPLGHIAGTAASVINAVSIIVSVSLAIGIGQAFNGTPVPLLIATVVCSAAAFWLIRGTTDDPS